MSEIVIQNNDLILNVSRSYDINNFDINKYEGFLDRLCSNRYYQKEAIKNICVYLLGGRYKNLEDLARENYNSNPFLKEKHGNIDNFIKNLQLKNKLSCNIDLATGTGKSFVIYGVAQIMLCEGKIDRVLVLCPSNTIQDGLTEKFKLLATDKDLKKLLPTDSAFKNPRIKQADGTIEVGDICIENIHSTYKNTKSAIEDSLINNGENTLVLNDESHHIWTNPNRENSDLKKWFEFLNDKDYNFKYIVGFTGTPYIKDQYFSDIIYRFSLIDAIEQKYIKTPDYISDSEIKIDKDNRMQIIYQNHLKNRNKYFKIKPITIFISKDIKHCKIDRENIIDYLVKNESISKEEAEKKVLIITSHKDHKTQENLNLFKTVNEKSNPVEWICSVAMLTEGWDVPNVFQIVPSEEKAFNSKLLISQVIGRGLRIPQEYSGDTIHVKILNHTKFSENISHLVDEVLEKEEKLYSYPVKEKEGLFFPIYNLKYSEEQFEIEKEMVGEYNFERLKKEGINLPADLAEESLKITYSSIGDSENQIIEDYSIKRETIKIDILANDIFNRIKNWDIELETNYSEDYDFESIKEILQKSLDKRGIKNITKEIATKCLQAFGTLKRFGNKNVRYELKPKSLDKLEIFNIGKSGISLSTIKKQKGYVFYDENSFKYSENDDKGNLKNLTEEIGPKFLINISNSFLFKTPLNLIHTISTPEKEFITELIKEENSKFIEGFIKSKDRGFYNFKYTYRKGEHPTTENFNPDFFIKSGNNIIVIEIKGNESGRNNASDLIKNRAKYEKAKFHFNTLNNYLKENKIDFNYHFHFCRPKDYKTFFSYLKSGNIDKYLSSLDYNYEQNDISDSDIKKIENFNDINLTKLFNDKWDLLEERTKIFLTTAEKNYFDNKDNSKYNFSGAEIIKSFETELRWKLFDNIRDDEELSYKIIDEEKGKDKYINQKLINFLNFKNDFIDLGSMENAMRYNSEVKNFLKDNFYGLNNLPDIISKLRTKYRNEDSHGEKVISKSEFEELRNLILFGDGILIKFIGYF
ncbi:hypothetical protein DLH72_05215 [Candidatus Gracilibacteria bacterium]|nr:MAG: hypothetical protein DLH72_05215 [Candidatus Gracilibacteria bacterium]